MIVPYTRCTCTLLKGAGTTAALPSSYYTPPIAAHYDRILIQQIHETRAGIPSFCMYYNRTMIILVSQPGYRHYAGTTTLLLLYYDSMSLVLRLFIFLPVLRCYYYHTTIPNGLQALRWNYGFTTILLRLEKCSDNLFFPYYNVTTIVLQLYYVFTRSAL